MRTRIELLADLRDMSQDETLTAIDRATAAQAADLLDDLELFQWAEEVGATMSRHKLGDGKTVWRCDVTNATHFKRMFSDGEGATMRAAIRDAKEAYENQ